MVHHGAAQLDARLRDVRKHLEEQSVDASVIEAIDSAVRGAHPPVGRSGDIASILMRVIDGKIDPESPRGIADPALEGDTDAASYPAFERTAQELDEFCIKFLEGRALHSLKLSSRLRQQLDDPLLRLLDRLAAAAAGTAATNEGDAV